ncbi:hypothetical protein P4V43_03675 [Brevibacillus fortis]|uniref:hypothetical protein n=1 Tax=Brevibacillus fortis TaxID=2126352 RepID=UPI002E1FCE15|nr:hypothetical protein [Brevibacillus fortis]
MSDAYDNGFAADFVVTQKRLIVMIGSRPPAIGRFESRPLRNLARKPLGFPDLLKRLLDL